MFSVFVAFEIFTDSEPKSTKTAVRKTKKYPKVFNFPSLIQRGLPQMQILICWFNCSSFRIFIPLGQFAEKTLKLWKELKPSISHFAFSEVSLMSKSYPRVELYLFWSLLGITVIWKNCLPVSPISTVLPIFISWPFRAFNYYSIMWAMYYFRQVILAILEND